MTWYTARRVALGLVLMLLSGVACLTFAVLAGLAVVAILNG